MIVDRALLDGGLVAAAKAHGVTVLQPARVRHRNRCNGQWRLEIENRRERVVSRFLIDASGRGSRYRRKRLGPPRWPSMEIGANASAKQCSSLQDEMPGPGLRRSAEVAPSLFASSTLAVCEHCRARSAIATCNRLPTSDCRQRLALGSKQLPSSVTRPRMPRARRSRACCASVMPTSHWTRFLRVVCKPQYNLPWPQGRSSIPCCSQLRTGLASASATAPTAARALPRSLRLPRPASTLGQISTLFE